MKSSTILKIPKYIYRSLKGELRKLPNYKAPKIPKVAFCLYGLIGNIKGKAGDTKVGAVEILKISHQHYKKHIFDKNENVDIFIHTWSVELEKEIRDLYRPKKAIFQKQKVFDVSKYVEGEYQRKQNHYSRWYSTKKVMELKAQYEKENNFEYDYVFIIRFDIAWQKDLIFSNFDPQYFYAANCFQMKPFLGKIYLRYGYPYQKEGLADLWFFSNSDYMDAFSTLFENLNEYNKPNHCPLSPKNGISNHKLASYHLKQKNIIKNLRFVFEHHGPNEVDPAVRIKYFNSRI